MQTKSKLYLLWCNGIPYHFNHNLAREQFKTLKVDNFSIVYYNVDVPNLVTYLNQTPKLEQFMARCGSKNGYQIDPCDWIFLNYVLKMNSEHNEGDLTYTTT